MAKAESIKVFVRIRPASENDYRSDDSDCSLTSFEYNAKENEFNLKNKVYKIDGILPPPTKQTDVFHRVATDPIQACDSVCNSLNEQKRVFLSLSTQSFLEGYNSTIFAYGQTGSGKTHTIFGPEFPSKSLLSTPTKSNFNSSVHRGQSPGTPSFPEMQSLFGLVPRCFITVFERLKSANHISKHQITLSCVEVYNVGIHSISIHRPFETISIMLCI